jgi:hypothetical protein
VSGNNTLQRATAVPSPALPGGGNWVMQMAVFRDASWTVAGAWSPVRVGQVVDASQFPGSDIGAKVNNAYASLFSTGGTILIPSSANCFQYNTAIAFTTPGKPAILQGTGTSPVCLLFTPPNGSAITMDWGSSIAGGGGGLANIKLLGKCSSTVCSGVTAIGINLGPTHGAANNTLQNVTVGKQLTDLAVSGCLNGCGFLNGINIATNYGGFGLKLSMVNIFGSNVGLNDGVNVEGLHIDDSFISQNAVGLNCAGEIHTNHVHFDDNTTMAVTSPTTVNNCAFIEQGDHFENGGTSGCGLGQELPNYFNFQNAVQWTSHGGQWFDRRPTGMNCALTTVATVADFSNVDIDATYAGLNSSLTNPIVTLSGTTGPHTSATFRFLEANPGMTDYTGGFAVIDAPIFGNGTLQNFTLANFNLVQPGVAFASLPGSPAAGTSQFCTNCVPTTASACSTNTPASCACKAGTGSMWAKYENFVNNGANWYCH